MPTQRYKLLIAYRGTNYHGWQHQALTENYRGTPPLPGHGIPTIQEILTRGLQSVLGHPITLIGSSRTDAGVHAKGQVAHFDTDQSQIPLEGLRQAANSRIPDDILIRQIEPAEPDFDAISSTISKRYQYLIWNAPERPCLFPDLAWHRWQPLDISAMQTALQNLIGTHDFTSFARPSHRKESSVRTILSANVCQRGPRIVIALEGTGFLWNMIRIIVGTIVEVGVGRTDPNDIPKILQAKNRRSAGPTAPPQGLYLQWINFKFDVRC